MVGNPPVNPDDQTSPHVSVPGIEPSERPLPYYGVSHQSDFLLISFDCDSDIGDTVIDHTSGEAVERTESERDVEIYRIPAHRVVIAARCDWFRRALLSGMKESIDR